MNLDLRFPIGILFLGVGLVMTGYGLLTNGSEMYARTLGININLWWGALLAVFALLNLLFAWRSGSAKKK